MSHRKRLIRKPRGERDGFGSSFEIPGQERLLPCRSQVLRRCPFSRYLAIYLVHFLYLLGGGSTYYSETIKKKCTSAGQNEKKRFYNGFIVFAFTEKVSYVFVTLHTPYIMHVRASYTSAFASPQAVLPIMPSSSPLQLQRMIVRRGLQPPPRRTPSPRASSIKQAVPELGSLLLVATSAARRRSAFQPALSIMRNCYTLGCVGRSKVFKTKVTQRKTALLVPSVAPHT